MSDYIHAMMSLPDSLRDDIFGYYDQQQLSCTMCAMSQIAESDEVLLFREYMSKHSKQRSVHLLQLPGVRDFGLPDFENTEPNFICLPKVPRSQMMVGPRCIDNRPAWLTTSIPRDFICIQQSSTPVVNWAD